MGHRIGELGLRRRILPELVEKRAALGLAEFRVIRMIRLGRQRRLDEID